MRYLFTSLVLIISLSTVNAQDKAEQPRLVVGIVVDQMRQEYLYRYYDTYGDNGFKRLINEGFMLKNAHFNYGPTFTGPGHASVYTGTTPAIHGIISNDFYDRQSKQSVYCAGDNNYKAVGSSSNNGRISPSRMLTTSITDELKLFTQKRAKVIAMAHKDRGAALPGGHMADAAYWYDNTVGHFITSTYYMEKLPQWVNKFNKNNSIEKLVKEPWQPLMPIEKYIQSGPDDTPYENKLVGKDKPVFPYDLSKITKDQGLYEYFLYTPYANDLLTNFAIESVEAEQLGKRDVTDFLAISYSTPDYLGHAVGPNAIELQDMYMRLDKNIAQLLDKLDANVGKGKYTVFLTADHAVAEVPQFMVDNKVPAGYFSNANLRVSLNEYLATVYPDKTIVENISNEQIFLTDEILGDPVLLDEIQKRIINFLMNTFGVYVAYSSTTLQNANFDEGGIKGLLTRGYNQKRSGHIMYQLQPGWFSSSRVQGTTHGSVYTYDTHVPILFYGSGIKQGSSVKYYSITDIAPTLSMLLKIKLPNGSTGQPIGEVLK
jgi:predicted AlkP superfamily pyrophosphatase or phosphodiesterase